MPFKSTSKKFLSQFSDNFSFKSAKPHQFYRSQWELLELEENYNYGYNAGTSSHPQVSLAFLIYRGIYMLLLVSSITFSTTCQSHLFHIFLTNWSFTSQNLYAILFFVSVAWRWWSINRKDDGGTHHQEEDVNNVELGNVQEMIKSKSDSSTNANFVYNENDYPSQLERADCSGGGDNLGIVEGGHKQGVTGSSSAEELTYLEKVIWILMNIVHVMPYCVVLGYWCVVYKHDPDQPLCEKFRSHYIVHGATAVLAFVDTLVIAVPARITHCLIPSGLMVVYLLFTYLHEIGGGPYRNGKEFIYSVLDWKHHPSKAVIFSVVTILLTPLAHTLFCWGIYRFRMCLYGFHMRNKSRK